MTDKNHNKTPKCPPGWEWDEQHGTFAMKENPDEVITDYYCDCDEDLPTIENKPGICPRCGQPLTKFKATRGERAIADMEAFDWAETNKKAMEETGGSWDY